MARANNLYFNTNSSHTDFHSFFNFSNILQSDIKFSEYADSWLNNYQLYIEKDSLPMVISKINIAKQYFGSKCLKNITVSDYKTFINTYALFHDKASVEQINSIMQNLLKSALNTAKYKLLLKI